MINIANRKVDKNPLQSQKSSQAVSGSVLQDGFEQHPQRRDNTQAFAAVSSKETQAALTPWMPTHLSSRTWMLSIFVVWTGLPVLSPRSSFLTVRL